MACFAKRAEHAELLGTINMKTLTIIIAFLIGYTVVLSQDSFSTGNPQKTASKTMNTCVLLPPLNIEVTGGSSVIRIIKGTIRTGLNEAAGFVVTGLPLNSVYQYRLSFTPPPYGDGSGLTVNGNWEIYDWNSDTYGTLTSGSSHSETSDGATPPKPLGLDVHFLVNQVDAQTNPVGIDIGFHDITIVLNCEYVAI